MALKSNEVSLGTQVTQRYCNGFIILFTQTMQTKHFSPYSPLDKYRNTTAGLQGTGKNSTAWRRAESWRIRWRQGAVSLIPDVDGTTDSGSLLVNSMLLKKTTIQWCLGCSFLLIIDDMVTLDCTPTSCCNLCVTVLPVPPQIKKIPCPLPASQSSSSIHSIFSSCCTLSYLHFCFHC